MSETNANMPLLLLLAKTKEAGAAFIKKSGTHHNRECLKYLFQ